MRTLALVALLGFAALPATAQEGGRDPFGIRTPGVTTVIPSDGAPVTQLPANPPPQAAPGLQPTGNPSPTPRPDEPRPASPR